MAAEQKIDDKMTGLVKSTHFVGMDSKGLTRLTAETIAGVMEKSQNQAKLAIACLVKYPKTVTAPIVLSWMTDAQAAETVKLWCKGKGIDFEIPIEEVKEETKKVDPIIEGNKELIDALAGNLSHRDMARILAIKKYRDGDDIIRNTLISGAYRALTDYLGPRRYYKRDQPPLTPLSLPNLPNELFEDQAIADVLASSQLQAVRAVFAKSWQEGEQLLDEMYASDDHPAKRRFTNQLKSYWQAVKELEVSGFNTQILGTRKDIAYSKLNELTPGGAQEITYPFPAAHQKEYGYRFAHKKIGPLDLLLAATGTGKSKGLQYAMKAAGAQSSLIICPSHLRPTWVAELEESLTDKPTIHVIEGINSLKKLVHSDKPKASHYIIMSYSLLSNLSDEQMHLLDELVAKFNVDSVGADECQMVKEAEAECTKQLIYLSKLLPEKAPRIAMTATGVVNTVEDLDAPVRFLLPHKYPNPGDFTRAARNDPYLVSAYLYSMDLLTRWPIEDILGHELPATEYIDVPVPLSYFHEAIYEYVLQDNTSEGMIKRGMLRQALLDPNLIRKYYHPTEIVKMIADLEKRVTETTDERKQAELKERIAALRERFTTITEMFTPESALRELGTAFQRYLEWQIMENLEQEFNEDFLIKAGFEKLAVWAFLTQKKGVTDLVNQLGNETISALWMPEEIVSSKYKALKRDLDRDIASGEVKQLIFSAFYQDNVTTSSDLSSEEISFTTLYDYLCQWYGEDRIVVIDGNVDHIGKKGSLSKREVARRRLRLDPETKGLLTAGAAKLGIDLTVPNTPENIKIKKVVEYVLDAHETASADEQTVGRVRRRGQRIPLESRYYKATTPERPVTLRYGYVDQMIWEATEYKRLISQMTIDAIPLTEEEERIYREHTGTIRVDTIPLTPRMYFLRHFWRQVRGAGYEANSAFFNQTGFEGMSNADFFASFYSQMELGHYNARAVSEVVKAHLRHNTRGSGRIGSMGAGDGVLQQTLGLPIVNIDMLPDILLEARAKQETDSLYTVGNIAAIPLRSRVLSVNDASLVLHWTNNNPFVKDGHYTTERIESLKEMVRVTEPNGLVTLSLPESYLTDEQFKQWVNVASYFGLKLAPHVPSGKVIATDFRTEPVSWLLNFVKVQEPSGLLTDPNTDISTIRQMLLFDFENITRYIEDQEKKQQEYRLSVRPPVPHKEFEVVSPLKKGDTQKLVYTPEDAAIRYFENLFDFSVNDITLLEVQEFGYYRRLRKVLKSDELALEVLNRWIESGTQKHNAYRIWAELLSLAEEVRKS
jgi:hypothetical protein